LVGFGAFGALVVKRDADVVTSYTFLRLTGTITNIFMNLKSILLPALLTALLFSKTAFALHPHSGRGNDFPSQRIDSLLASFPQDGPGGVVAVVENGRVLYIGAYGYAQVEWQMPASTKACYRIGSLTKSFTALAVLKLAEAGKLNLDDKIYNWLPDVEADERITIRHLLSHTSGILPHSAVTEFTPGDRMNYSNYGYLLLGDLVEKASGSTWEHYLTDNIFSPLGMHRTGVEHFRNLLPQRAAGYETLNGQTVNAAWVNIEGAGAAGALYSSASDLVLFATELTQNRVLPASLVEASMQAFTLSNGSSSSYGLGWMTGNYRGWKEAAHGGDIDGFNCFFTHFPDKQLTVLVLQNSKMQMNSDQSNSSRLAHRIVDMAWADELESDPLEIKIVELSDVQLQQLAGTYAFENAPGEMIAAMGPSLTVYVDNGKLMVRDKTGTVQLDAISESEFVLPGIDIRLIFHHNEGPHPSGLNLMMLGVRNLYARRMP
jgi:D-alanyl-D-alanine carboxypeptidase